MQRVEIFLMNRFQDLVLSIPVCTTPTSIRSCTRNMLSGLLTFGSATAYEKKRRSVHNGGSGLLGRRGSKFNRFFVEWDPHWDLTMSRVQYTSRKKGWGHYLYRTGRWLWSLSSWGLVYFYSQFFVSDDHIFNLNFIFCFCFVFFGVFLSVLVAACFRWVMRRYFGGKTGGWCVNKSGDSFSERVLVSSSCPKVRQWIYVAIHLSIDSCSPHLKHH